MKETSRTPAATQVAPETEDDEAFQGFVEAMGLLPPEALRDPDLWLPLSDTGPLQPMAGNLARIPLLSERWE